MNNDKIKNKYDLTGEYGIGYDCKRREFYFDLEDYDKIKNICWHVNNNKNRVYGRYKGKNIEISKIITNNTSELIDHINLNPRDNRKSNLRVATIRQNQFNRKGYGKMSKFGLKGIHWNVSNKKWQCRVRRDGKIMYNKYFYYIEDAIKDKIEFEKEYFGEYRYAWENDILWDELLEYEKILKKIILAFYLKVWYNLGVVKINERRI